MSATRVLLNDFVRQWEEIGPDAIAAVERVGASGWYVLGREVGSFERSLAELWGARHAVGVGSGLDAIEVALRVLGLRPAEKVITTPLSAFATTLAIRRAGGEPVFVDVDKNGQLDLDRCEAALEADNGIRFMVPVHLYGQAMNLERMAKLRDRFGLKIVEDCAQAIGARWKQMAVGSVGEIAATSFYPTKNLGALGDGGALLTNSEELAVKSRCLRDYGQRARYEHVEWGLNSRLDEVHAAILGDALITRLEEWTAKRRKTAHEYLKGIKNRFLNLPVSPPEATPVWHLFPVVVASGSREGFTSFLTERGVQTGVHYPILIPDQEVMHRNGCRPVVVGELDQARRIAYGEVSLPVHPFLTDEERGRVVAACNEWTP